MGQITQQEVMNILTDHPGPYFLPAILFASDCNMGSEIAQAV
jgi:hypothetical protein